jgi:hypothetical protein
MNHEKYRNNNHDDRQYKQVNHMDHSQHFQYSYSCCKRKIIKSIKIQGGNHKFSKFNCIYQICQIF